MLELAHRDQPGGSVLDEASSWLLDEAWRLDGIGDIVEGFCTRLATGGLPLARLGAVIGTLHPQIRSYYFVWRRGEDIEEYKGEHGIETTDRFVNSPFPPVFYDGVSVRHRLEGRSGPFPYPILDDLKAEGITDYVVMPMEFGGGERNALSFAIERPGGFADAELLALYPLVALLGRVLETKALRRTAVNLLDTYVGRNAGERILQGKILRGDAETLHAAIWLCDLRDFTTLSETRPSAEVVETLNRFLECMAEPVSEHGGEVSKFLGDGLLAVFPAGEDDIGEACGRARDAAQAAVGRMAAWNADRAAASQDPLGYGIALHRGEVMFGNVGATDRLDFTVIGPAVNMVSRLERECASLGCPVLASGPFAELVPPGFREAGVVRLRGIAGDHPVFALDVR